MRLDLFLKWSRVILRRTLAKEVCDAGRVKVNGVEARAGREIRIADTVEIDFPRRRMKCRVRSIPPHAPGKEGAREMLEVLEDRRNSPDSE
jgi:ribosomal 50S subunit-recycling heat shock protein